MEEKKLTDDEIVKAFELCSVKDIDCKECPYSDTDYCGISKEEIVDLINRQKSEIERLTSLYDGQSAYMTSSIGDLPLTVEGLRKAVDEIARLLIVQVELQELNVQYYNDAKDLRRANKDLQMQVQRLRNFIDFRTANVMCDKCKEQAVKDTAKEILQELYEYPHEYHERKILEIAKRKGVEVE